MRAVPWCPVTLRCSYQLNYSFLLLDVGIVNAICLDKKSNHIYWTDERKKRIEMANYNGSQRATIINSGLSRPRGITVDTVKW